MEISTTEIFHEIDFETQFKIEFFTAVYRG